MLLAQSAYPTTKVMGNSAQNCATHRSRHPAAASTGSSSAESGTRSQTRRPIDHATIWGCLAGIML
jgi:hypothetical protein